MAYTYHYLWPEGMFAVFRETSNGGQMFIDQFMTEEEAADYCDRMNKAESK